MKKSINIKKIVLWTSISLVFAIIVAVNVNISLNSASRSIATMLENVEALSTGESGAVATETCYHGLRNSENTTPQRVKRCPSETNVHAIYPCPSNTILMELGTSDRCVRNP